MQDKKLKFSLNTSFNLAHKFNAFISLYAVDLTSFLLFRLCSYCFDCAAIVCDKMGYYL